MGNNGLIKTTEFTSNSIKKKKSNAKKGKNLFLLCLALPMVLYKLIYSYLPMIGIVLAFKDYRYDLGIFGSPWSGLKNFEFFFKSPDAFRTARNTLGYNAVFIITGTVFSIIIALLLYEIRERWLIKYLQTTMLLPHFMSWVIVAFILYGFLSYNSGILNNILVSMGLERVNWYTKKEPWVLFIPVAHLWKSIGMSSLLYYSTLMGVDPSYFEAAKVEGANRFQIARKITIPFLYPIITILTILAIGKIFNADFGMFYQLPKESPMLFATTDVIETYTYRALREKGNIGMSTAVELYKSTIGLILVFCTNRIVKKINPDNALF